MWVDSDIGIVLQARLRQHDERFASFCNRIQLIKTDLK